LKTKNTFVNTTTFQTLRELLPVIVHHVKFVEGQSKYDRMNACHCEAVARAQNDGQAVVILSPDCLFSSQCLTRAEKNS